MNFFDLFDDNEEYPENIAERGVPENILYEYVSSQFLSGLVNYVKPFWVCVLERYTCWKTVDLSQWDKKAAQFHPDYAGIDDDILMLAETENNYWFFWSDRDVSDCCVGRIGKTKTTKEEMKRLLIEWITDHEHHKRPEKTESLVGNYHELVLPNGWIKF